MGTSASRAIAARTRTAIAAAAAFTLALCLAPLTAFADGEGPVAVGSAPTASQKSAAGATPNSALKAVDNNGSVLASTLAGPTSSILSADIPLDASDPLIGSFTVDGLTYSVNSDGLTLVAVDASAVAEDGSLAVPATVAYNGVTYPVTAIGSYAFYLSNATDVALPASVASVDSRAFRTSAVGSVSAESGNPNYASFDGALYSANLSSLLLIPEGRAGAVLLPSETEVAEPSVFSHCSLVEAIDVEEGGAAFASWDGLLYDALGETLLRVPAGVTEITIRDGCTAIAAGALEGCAKLERIHAPASVTSISPDVFQSVPTVALPAQSALRDEVSSGVASALADQLNDSNDSGPDASIGATPETSEKATETPASTDTTPQLTGLVALSAIDDDLPQINSSAITVALPDGALCAPWEQAGLTIEGGSSNEAVHAPLPAAIISEDVELSGFAPKGEALSENLPSAVIQSGSTYVAGTTTVDPNGGELWQWHNGEFTGNQGVDTPMVGSSWEHFIVSGAYLNRTGGSESWTWVGYYDGVYCIGWSRTPNNGLGGSKLANGYEFTSTEGTIYACWPYSAVNYRMNFGNDDRDLGTRNTVVAQPMPTAGTVSQDGYDFTGYWDARTGGVQYHKADGTSARKWNKDTATTLYAQWSKKASYTVTLDKKGGSGGAASPIYYWPEKGYTTSPTSTAVLSTVSKPSLSGWTFSGYTDDLGTNSYLYINSGGAPTTRTLTSDKTLLANWTKTVTLNKNATSATAGSLTSLTAGIGRPLGQKSTGTNAVDKPIQDLFSKGITDNSDWAPTRAGYTFQGYYDTSASTGGTRWISASGTGSTVTSSLPSTLYARWTKNAIYTVTLNSQLWASSSSSSATASATTAGTTAIYYWVGKGWYSTSSPSDTATAATTATALITQPTLSGYTYGGYWTTKGGSGTQKISGQKLVSTSSVSASTTWYAKWTKNAVHTVNIYQNAGDTTTIYKTVYLWYGKGWYDTANPTLSSAAITTIGTPSRAGYSYVGTNTTSTATSNQYTMTSASAFPSSTYYGSASSAGTYSRYLVWKKNAVSTVNLYKNAGDTSTKYKTVYMWYGKGWYDTASPTDSSTALTTIGTPSWPGRTYKGFATSSTATSGTYWTSVTSFPSNTSSTFGSAATAKTTNLYAVWQGNEVTLTWSPHNGTDSWTTKQTHSTTSTVKVSLPTAPTWAGRTFAGWYTAETGGTQVTNATNLPTSSTTYHAHWTEDTYAISYDYDGGSVSGNPTTYKVTSDTFTLKNPTKTGYAFTGWSGTGLTGYANKSVTVVKGSTGNRSYTAHWAANSYAVEYYDPTGTALLSRDDGFVYDEYRAAADAPDGYPTPGYEVQGWATSPGQTSAYIDFGGWMKNFATGDPGDEVKRLYLAESPKQIALTWSSLGEEFATTSAAFAPDAKVPMPEGMPARDPGWAFMGWWTEEEGGEQVTAGTPLPTDSAEYYAHWSPVVSAVVPLEVTARVDLLGLEEQAEASGYIESRSGGALEVAEVSFEPLAGAAELFGASTADVFLEALAEGSTAADYRFALGAAATEADADKLAAFALPDGYGTRVGIGYRFAIPDDVLASIDPERFSEVTTPIGQVVYTVALAG